MEAFQFKSTPFEHQRRIWEETKDNDFHGLFMEMGTGKSKVAIDTCAWKHVQGKCDGMLVVAPNGVHQNWVSQELPRHMPDSIPCTATTYYTSKGNTKRHQKAVEDCIAAPGLAILCMSYDAIKTDRGHEYAERFLKTRQAMLVLDESARIKTPSAKCTQAIIPINPRHQGLAGLAKFRWILTGTPIANSPFDVYSQIRVLDPDYWRKMGLSPFSIFKRVFGIFENRPFAKFGICVGYQNLDRLHKLVDAVSTRITKDECLDLPPKTYVKYHFDLNPEQRRVYDTLRSEYMTSLEGGEEITAQLAIVRLTRLSQIACGFIKTDTEDSIIDIGDNNRLRLLGELCEDLDSAVIWAKYTHDIDLIKALLKDDCVVIDGRVPDSERGGIIERFQAGNVKFFVGQVQTISEGVTLHRASTAIFYSNDYKYDRRLQAEDRIHRIGQAGDLEGKVTIIDLVGRDTVDENVVDALRNKQSIASQVTGDSLKEWL